MGKSLVESPTIVELYKDNGVSVPSVPECQDGLELAMDDFNSHAQDIINQNIQTFEQLDDVETTLFLMLDCIRHAKAHAALRDYQEWQKGKSKKVQ